MRKYKKNRKKRKPWTDEQRKAHSERQKGEKAYWYGKTGALHPRYNTKHTEKTKKLMRKNHKGRTGQKHSEEEIRKARERMLGENNPMRGKTGSKNHFFKKKHKKKSLRLMSIASKKRWADPEFRKLQTKVHKDLWQDPAWRAAQVASHKTESYLAYIRERNAKQEKVDWEKRGWSSEAEATAAKVITDLGIKYEPQFPVTNIEHKYAADFYLPKYNCIVEIDGDYYHSQADKIFLDSCRNTEIPAAGYKLFRIRDYDLAYLRERLVAFLGLREDVL